MSKQFVAAALLLAFSSTIAHAGAFNFNIPPPVPPPPPLTPEQEAAYEAEQVYLHTKYETERGQSAHFRETLYAGLIDIYNSSVNDGQNREWGTVFYKDKYGFYYYTKPVAGPECIAPPGGTANCSVTLPWDDIERPSITVLGSGHTHPLGEIEGAGPDNSTNVQMWQIHPDGRISYFKTNSSKSKLYGKIEKGHVITAYDGPTSPTLADDNYDAYTYDGNGNGVPDVQEVMQDSGGGSFFSHPWKVLAPLITVGAPILGLFTLAFVGGGSSSNDWCCPGPPMSGYDPNADPTQVCRRNDGQDCR